MISRGSAQGLYRSHVDYICKLPASQLYYVLPAFGGSTFSDQIRALPPYNSIVGVSNLMSGTTWSSNAVWSDLLILNVRTFPKIKGNNPRVDTSLRGSPTTPWPSRYTQHTDPLPTLNWRPRQGKTPAIQLLWCQELNPGPIQEGGTLPKSHMIVQYQ